MATFRALAGHLLSPSTRGAATALACGVILTVQARLTGEIARTSESILCAALGPFVIGTVVLCGFLILARRPGDVSAPVVDVARRRVPRYLALGGVLGASSVLAQGTVVPRIGIGLFTICLVLGQTSMALVLDLARARWQVGVEALTIRLGSVALVALAAGLSGASRSGAVASLSALGIALGIGAGCAMSVQFGLNTELTRLTRRPLGVSALNLVVGSTILVVGAAVHAVLVGHAPSSGQLLDQAEPWWVLPGVIGPAFILMTMWAMSTMPALTYWTLNVGAQVVTSSIIDLASSGSASDVRLTLQGTAVVLCLGALLLLRRASRDPRPS